MFYVTVDVAGTPQILRNDIFAELTNLVHRLSAGKIAIAFPNLVNGDDEHHAHLGNTMRLFGSEENLKQFMSEGVVVEHVDIVCRLGGIIVPPSLAPQTSETRRYVRDRSADRMTPSRYRRDKTLPNKIPKNRKLNTSRLPYIIVQSKSSGHNYSIFVREETTTVVQTTGNVGSYGLSTSLASIIVPHF